MSEAILTKNTRARELKISGFTLLYPYFMLLKFQLDRTEFDLFFHQFFDHRENNYPPPVFCNPLERTNILSDINTLAPKGLFWAMKIQIVKIDEMFLGQKL